MGPFDQLKQSLPEIPETPTGNFGDFSDKSSLQSVHEAVASAPVSLLTSLFTQIAQRLNPQQYRDHITPGVNGTDPLGGLGKGALGFLASSLITHFTQQTGGSTDSLKDLIPGLRTTDPSGMDASQVALLADHMRTNHPGVFGSAATEIGKAQPGILQSLLGNEGMMHAAQSLMSRLPSH